MQQRGRDIDTRGIIMSARASHAHVGRNGYWDDYESPELFAGEPITPRRRRGGTLLPATIVLLVLFGGGYAALETKATWQQWLPADLDAWRALMTPRAPAPAEQKASLETPPAPQPVVSRDVAEAPKVEAGVPVPPAATTTLNAAAPDTNAEDEKASEEKPAPLPPITVDQSDPHQKRAMAVGLHPGLSRVLLTRMSDADYRNAGIAIKKALAETPFGEVLIWPRDSKGKDAVFEVKFVKSVSPDCRRYVVTVAKDRWSTTARPMEKCGLPAPALAKKSS